MEFQQSEPTATRRRWILVLVDSADGVTGKTGQIGTVEISKNGTAPSASTNSIVEVDSVNMPGHYYIELTAGELGTLGMISIYYKASGTLAFHDRGYVTYNDPFTKSGGAMFVGTPGSPAGIKKEQADDLLKKIRKIVKEEVAKIELPEPKEIEMPQIPDHSQTLGKILDCVEGMETDLSPVMEAIGKIPAAKDYSTDIAAVSAQVTELMKLGFADAAKQVTQSADLMGKMLADFNVIFPEYSKKLQASSSQYDEFKKMLDLYQTKVDMKAELAEKMDELEDKMEEKQMEELGGKIEALDKKFNEQLLELAKKIVNAKFDILDQLTSQKK